MTSSSSMWPNPSTQELRKELGTKNTLRSRVDASCLPPSITSVAPTCAIPCIQQFVGDNYAQASCLQTSNLAFLCTTQTTSSLTIGEGALQCEVSGCAITTDFTLYNICNNVQGAQSRSAKTITATIIPTATATNGATTTTNSIPTSSIAFTTANTPFPARTGKPTPSIMSSPARSAGLIGGTIVGGLAIFGLLIFLCTRRRRRDRWEVRRNAAGPESSASSLLDKKLPLLAPSNGTQRSVKSEKFQGFDVAAFQKGFAAATSIKTPRASLNGGGPTVNQDVNARSQDRRSFWRKSIKPEDIGVAVSPKEHLGFFRGSDTSNFHGTKSMMPIPESSVLPTAPSPIDSLNYSDGVGTEESGVFGKNVQKILQSSLKDFIPIPPIPKDSRPFSFAASSHRGDVEAQTETSSTSHLSFLTSAHTSMANITSLFVRKMSLKRDVTPSKEVVPSPPSAPKKNGQPMNNFMQTPKYDNGTFVADPPAASAEILPSTTYGNLQRPKLPRKPTFSSFLRGTLLPTTSSKTSPPPTSRSAESQTLPATPSWRPKGGPLGANPTTLSNLVSPESLVSAESNERSLPSTIVSPETLIPAPLSVYKGDAVPNPAIFPLLSPTSRLKKSRLSAKSKSSSRRTSRSKSKTIDSTISSPPPTTRRDYDNKALPPLTTTTSWASIAAPPSSIPSPPKISLGTGARQALSPADTSPRGRLAFPSVDASLNSFYAAYRQPVSGISSAGVMPAATFSNQPPLPVPRIDIAAADTSKTDGGGGGRPNTDVFSPESVVSGRNSMTPKWVVTPNRTKTGDLYLMVGEGQQGQADGAKTS